MNSPIKYILQLSLPFILLLQTDEGVIGGITTPIATNLNKQEPMKNSLQCITVLVKVDASEYY